MHGSAKNMLNRTFEISIFEVSDSSTFASPHYYKTFSLNPLFCNIHSLTPEYLRKIYAVATILHVTLQGPYDRRCH